MARDLFRSSINRLLARRLGFVALIVCVIFSAIAFVSEQARVRDVITELAPIDAFASIAENLYTQYGGQDGDKPRRRLEEISQKYFKTNIVELMA